MELKHSLAIRVLHWLMAVMIISLLCVGLIMSDLPRDEPLRATLYSLHKSFGVTVLMLCGVRIVLRLYQGVPALPEAISALERRFAKLGHLALYAFMLAMPVSGIIMSNAFGFPVRWFGLELPRITAADRDLAGFFADFHTYAGFALIGLLLLHTGAVAKHTLKDRVNLLSRML